MSHDPRYASGGTGGSAPIVHIHDQRANGMMGAVASAMMFQFLILMVIAWRVFTPVVPDDEGAAKLSAAIDRLDNIKEIASEEIDAERQLWEANLKVKAVDEALARADKLSPGELIRGVRSDVDAALVEEQILSMTAHSRSLRADLTVAEGAKKRAVSDAKKARELLLKARKNVVSLKEDNKKVEKEFKAWKKDKASQSFKAMMSDYRWVTGLILALIVLIAGTAYATLSIRGFSDNTLADAELGSSPPERPPVHDSQWENTQEDSR